MALDLFLGLHHGTDSSNSEVMIHATHPRVAIMNNGTRKGGQPEVMKVLFSSPGLEDLWQMHFSQLSGQEETMPCTSHLSAAFTDRALAALAVQARPITLARRGRPSYVALLCG